jgi:hypothetical protein
MRLTGLVLFLTQVVWGGTLEIGDRNYTFENIISQTKFRQEKTKMVYSNPFDGYTATINLVLKKLPPGTSEAENYWFVDVPNFDIQFDLEKHVLPIYGLKIVLVPLTKTVDGTMSFKAYSVNGNGPGLTLEIFNVFISAIERLRWLDPYCINPVVIKLTGKLELSGTFQNNGFTAKKAAQIEYGFFPEKVELSAK